LGFDVEVPEPPGVGDGVKALDPFPGVFVDAQIGPVVPLRTHGGQTLESFNDLIKERLLISPAVIDVGLIVSSQTFTGIIWNNYRVTLQDATLDEMIVSGNEGIALDGLAVNDVILATKSIEYIYTVTNIGPVIIDAEYDFVFDLQTLEQDLFGFRGSVLISEPLADGYGENRAFTTNLFRSIGGREYRQQLSNDPIPVRSTEMSIKAFTRAELSQLENVIRFGAAFNIVVPLWFSLTKLTDDTNALTNILSVESTDHREFSTVNQLVIIGVGKNINERQFVVRQIMSLTATTIVVNGPPGAGWFAGDYVLPCIGATPQTSSSFEYLIERRASAKLSFQEIR
jgi:hypothetical protein